MRQTRPPQKWMTFDRADVTLWLESQMAAASVLPSGDRPAAVHCSKCGDVLWGLSAGRDAIGTQRFEFYHDGTQTGVRATGPTTLRRRDFEWPCQSCGAVNRVSPPKPR
jgi:hypothetical protein